MVHAQTLMYCPGARTNAYVLPRARTNAYVLPRARTNAYVLPNVITLSQGISMQVGNFNGITTCD